MKTADFQNGADSRGHTAESRGGQWRATHATVFCNVTDSRHASTKIRAILSIRGSWLLFRETLVAAPGVLAFWRSRRYNDLLVTKDHQPVEFFLTPGSFSDTVALEQFDFDLPKGAGLFADKAYTFYLVEDLLAEAEIQLVPDRKKNSKRPLPPWLRALLAHYRNQVERVPTGRGSLIERLLPKSIHAITAKGFELKVILFTLAASINCLYLTLAALYYHEVFLGHNLG